MARVRTTHGEWWTVYVDVTGPRLRWRPLEWWQARNAGAAPPEAEVSDQGAGRPADRIQRRGVSEPDGPFVRPADSIGQYTHHLPKRQDPVDRTRRRTRWWGHVDPMVDELAALFVLGVGAAAMFLAMLLGLIVLPIVVVVIDALLIVVGVGALFVWRTMTRAGWHVVARSDDGAERRWHADGLLAARRTRRAISDALRTDAPIVAPDATEVAPD